MQLFKNGVEQENPPLCAILVEKLVWDTNGDEDLFIATLSDGQRIKVPSDSLWIATAEHMAKVG